MTDRSMFRRRNYNRDAVIRSPMCCIRDRYERDELTADFANLILSGYTRHGVTAVGFSILRLKHGKFT